MADPKIKGAIEIEDKSGAGLKSAQSNLDKFTGTVKKFAAIAGVAFAAKQVFDFGKASVKAFTEAEASAAKMNTTVKNALQPIVGQKWVEMTKKMGIASGDFDDVVSKVTGKIKDLASATTKLGFDDEAAAESIANLFQRTGDLTKATELNNLAMDLARTKNIDLATASGLVGMVLSGNGRVLKQYGIEIDDAMTPMEALGVLHDKVRGQAAAFADTTAGKLEIMSIAWGNFKENVGATLVGVLLPFIEKLSDVVNKLSQLDLSLQNIKVKFTEWFALLDQKTGIVGYLTELFNNLVFLWQQYFLPILEELWNRQNGLNEIFKSGGVVILGTLVVAITALGVAILGVSAIISALIVIIAGFIVWLKDRLTDAIYLAIEAWDSFLKKIEEIIDSFKRAIDLAKELAAATGGKISGAFKATKSFLGFRADGGQVGSGRPYVVGERGPEIFTPNTTGSIIPNNKIGSSVTINITGNTLLDGSAGNKIAQQIMYQLRGALRF